MYTPERGGSRGHYTVRRNPLGTSALAQLLGEPLFTQPSAKSYNNEPFLGTMGPHPVISGQDNIPLGPSGPVTLEDVKALNKKVSSGKNRPTKAEQTQAIADLLSSNPGNVATEQLAALAQKLFGSTDPAQYDPSKDIAAAMRGINQQYGGAIGGYKQANRNARGEAQYGSKQTMKLYRALKKSMMHDAKVETRAGKGVAKQLNALGQHNADAARQRIESEVNQNAAVAKGLGNEKLATTLNAALEKQANSQAATAVRESQGSAQDQIKLGSNYAASARNIGRQAMTEGTQRSADLYSQLQGFVQQNLSKIASLRGESAAAKAQARAAISSNAAEAYNNAQSDNASNLWDAMLSVAQLSNDQNNSSVSNWAKIQDALTSRTNAATSRYRATHPTSTSSATPYNPYPKGISNANMILDQNPGLASAFNAIVNSAQASAKYGQDMTNPNTVMQIIMNNKATRNLSSSQKQALLAAAINWFS